MGRGEGLSSEPPMDPPLHTHYCSIARSDQDYIFVNTRCVCEKQISWNILIHSMAILNFYLFTFQKLVKGQSYFDM